MHTVRARVALTLGRLVLGLLLDKGVDNVILHGVHDEREQHHHKHNLHLFVAFGPSEGPIADTRDPGQHDKDDEDTQLHAEQAAKVNDGLLQPPQRVGWVSVVARLDRLGGLAEPCFGEQRGQDSEEEDEDGDAEGGLQCN